MNQFTSVLAAKIGTSQAKALIRVDDLGDAVDAKVVKVWRKILRLIHADPMPRDFLHQLYDLLSSVVGTAQAALSTGLVKQAQQVHEDVTAEVFSQLPPGHKIMLAQMASPPQLTEAKATAEQAEQMKGMIFPPQTEAAARSIVHRSTAGVGWEARLAQQTTLAPPGQLASLITTWRATGTTPKIMEEAMMPLVNGVRSTARRVARTEGQRVASQTRLESYEALGDLVIGYQIHATMDSHTRPHHAARNGQTYFKNPSAGQLSSTDMPIPPQESDGSVAHNCRCVTGDCRINGYFKSIARFLYDGEFTKIRTAGGAEITVTSNHPIATRFGLVAANKISEGDYILTDSVNVRDLAADVKNTVPTIEDVFQSILIMGGQLTLVNRPDPLDFHGDGQFTDGEVHIVFSDNKLMVKADSTPIHFTDKNGFILAKVVQMSLPNLNAPGVIAHSRPFDSLGTGPGPGANSTIQQPLQEAKSPSGISAASGDSTATDSVFLTQNIQGFASQIPGNKIVGNFFELGQGDGFRFSPETDPAAGEPSANSFAFDADFAAYLLQRFSGNIAMDKVIDIRRFHGRNLVYSVDSHNGYYMASSNSVQVANGNCWITPIVDVQPQIEDDPAAKKLFTDAEANLVPDPASYADWFATASPGERRKAAGSRRLSAAQDRLPPDQTVSWVDVLKLNGELLTAEELTRESEEARLARVKAVGDLIDRRRELARKIAQFGYLPPELGGTRAAVPVPVPPVEPVLVEPGKLTLADLPPVRQPTPGDLNPHFPATILPVAGMDLLRLKTLQLATDEAKRVGAVGLAADGLLMEHAPAHLLGGITAKTYDVSSVAKDLLFGRLDYDPRGGVLADQVYLEKDYQRVASIYASAKANVADNYQATLMAKDAILLSVKNSEATKKLRTKADQYMTKPTMPTLKALQKKYGAKNLATILKINAKQLEEYEMLAAHVPADLNAIRGGRRWKTIMEERQANLEAAHQNIATAAAVLETLEEDADLARPIPRWACAAFPEIAKKSIRKLAEPFRARFDSMKAAAIEEPKPVIRQPEPKKSDYEDVSLWLSARRSWRIKDDALNAVEREAEKKAFDKMKAQESDLKQKIHREAPGQSVGMQAITTRRDGQPVVYSDQYMDKKKKTDEFIGQVSGVAVPDLLFSDSANDLRGRYAKDYARAFCASQGIYQGDSSPGQSSGIERPAMFLHEKDNVGIWVHETGHAIEQADPYVAGMVHTFLNMRVGNEKPQEMKDLFPGRGFDPGEMGRKDHFDRAFNDDPASAYYVGKDYDHGTTEVLSMGIQKLHDDPLDFMKKDPEYFEFVVSVLQYQDAKAAAAPEPPPAVAKKTRKKKSDL